MATLRFARLLPALLCFLLLTAIPVSAAPPAITYTGQLLSSSGTPVANGKYDFQFGLYTASSGGSQVGATLSVANVPSRTGSFTSN